MKVIIQKQYSGKVLLNYLREILGISRALLIRLKNTENGITINGQHVTVRAVLAENDILELKLEDTEENVNPFIEPVELKFEKIYEDDYLIAVNKPAGMPTHTTHGHYNDSLANALCAKFKSESRPFVFRAVNRLDRDTSGVVLVAKDQLSAHKMSQQLQSGKIQKNYIAIVCGELNGEGEINGYIKRCGQSIITRMVCAAEEDGAECARTLYKVLFTNGKYSVVEASPITGRTHQLRVHFASIGHPIVGDSLYGSPDINISRQALHAISLKFLHPTSGEAVNCYAAIPDDIVGLCEKLGISTGIPEYLDV